MKVCAIVPTYNRKGFLIECLESLVAQTRPIDQIIVVDDGSTDGTDAALTSWTDRITYVRQENAGKSAALNRALAMTDADLIWICDDDDLALEDGLETLITPFLSDPGLDMVFARHMRFKLVEGERQISAPFESVRPGETNMNLSFWEDMVSYQFASLVCRRAYEEVGGFDTTLKRSLDYDMALRVTRGRNAAYVDKVVFLQREHGGARGPGGKITTHEQSLRTWLEYDQIIMRRLLPKYRVEEFAPAFAAAYSPEAKEAAALLERGLVLGKRGLWTEGAASLAESASRNTEITADERQLCAVMFRYHLPFALLLENDSATKLLRGLNTTPRGRQLVFALLRPARWMALAALRNRDLPQLRVLIMTLLSTLGPVGAILRLGSTRDDNVLISVLRS